MSFCRARIAMASLAVAKMAFASVVRLLRKVSMLRMVRMLSRLRYLVMVARGNARDNGFTPFTNRDECSCWLIAAV